jgi:hypothetical protein
MKTLKAVLVILILSVGVSHAQLNPDVFSTYPKSETSGIIVEGDFDDFTDYKTALIEGANADQVGFEYLDNGDALAIFNLQNPHGRTLLTMITVSPPGGSKYILFRMSHNGIQIERGMDTQVWNSFEEMVETRFTIHGYYTERNESINI